MEPKPISSPTFSTNPIITLNIGGTKYTTHFLTLVSNPNTLFKSLVNTLPKDRDGNIFVDRDPFYFRYILDSLRQGEIQHPFLPGTYDCIRYWKEIDFFRLLAPGHIWGFSRKKRSKHSSIAVSEDTFYARKISSSKSASTSVCGNKTLENGKFRWRVITEGIGGIVFGIVHSNSYKTDKLSLVDVYGLSTQGHLYNLEKYGGDDEDEDEDVEKKGSISLMKPEDELGKRVILNESDDEEGDNPEEAKENEDSLSSNDESGEESGDALKPKKTKKEDEKTEIKVKKEETFVMEYDAGDGTIKVYKQNEEIWYVGKIIDKKEGYYFFASLKNIGDKVRVELLQ